MKRLALCSNSAGGIGNRLFSFWSARRIDPEATLTWPRDRIGPVLPEYSRRANVEAFGDLFDMPGVCVERTDGQPFVYSWRLYAHPGEPRLDFLYERTPEPARTEVAGIAASMKLSAEVCQRTEEFCRNFDHLIGVHLRTRPDVKRVKRKQLESIARQVVKVLAGRPAFVCTDNAMLRGMLSGKKARGLRMMEVDAKNLIVSDWSSALCEMMALARCKSLLLHNKFSTFAAAAWWFGGGIQAVEELWPDDSATGNR